MNAYNGHSPAERLGKLKEMNRLLKSGELKPASGPCELCGDPDPAAKFEYHDEDYGAPPLWGKPAQYCVCLHCHRFKLHKRFVADGEKPTRWLAFLAHARRGGYARDLKSPLIKAEVERYRAALEGGGELPDLLPLNGGYRQVVGKEWFAHLRTDLKSLDDPSARPRPFDPAASFRSR